jgi:alpha-mannosidase
VNTDVNRISNAFYTVEKLESELLVVNNNLTGKELFRIDNAYCRIIQGQGPEAKTVFGRIKSIVPGPSGEVFNSFLVGMDVPGFRDYTIEVRLTRDLDQVDIYNRFHKVEVTDKEKVSFNFGLTVPESRTLYEIPWGVADPDRDLVRGSNKTYFTVQHFVDLSNENEGITLIPVDAPILEIRKDKSTGQTIYESVVVDNGWHTNFPATQSGPMEFRYVLRAHRSFDLTGTVKWALSQFQPLLAVRDPGFKIASPVKSIVGNDVISTSFRPDPLTGGWLIRLYNPGTAPSNAKLVPAEGYVLKPVISDGSRNATVTADLNILPKEIVTLQIIRK